MEHYQAKGVIFMIVAVLFCYSIGMVGNHSIFRLDTHVP